jgi:hypothetical protein
MEDYMKKFLLSILSIATVAIVITAATVAQGSGSDCDETTFEFIDEAITYLVGKEPHPLQGNAPRIAEISRAICEASFEYNVDAFLLVSMASFESNFRPVVLSLEKKGKRKEKGLLQCGPDCARTCPHFQDTVKGQALCGARWLHKAYRECGKGATDRQALAMYATGKTCQTKGDTHLTWVVNRRMTRAQRLSNMVQGH